MKLHFYVFELKSWEIWKHDTERNDFLWEEIIEKIINTPSTAAKSAFRPIFLFSLQKLRCRKLKTFKLGHKTYSYDLPILKFDFYKNKIWRKPYFRGNCHMAIDFSSQFNHWYTCCWVCSFPIRFTEITWCKDLIFVIVFWPKKRWGFWIQLDIFLGRIEAWLQWTWLD